MGDLWPEATGQQRDEVVACAGGLPLFVAELAARGGRGATPASVRSLVEARVAGCSGLERRALWAAALLGRRAPWEAIEALLAEEASAALAGGALERLVDAWLLSYEPAHGSFGFRHELIREVALDLAPAAELSELHGRALAWLGPRGEHEALLAWHAERSGRRAEAAGLYAAASWRALGSDIPAALRLAERALACGPDEGGLALGCQVMALGLLGRWQAGEEAARVASERARPGSLTWLAGVGVRCFASFEAGRMGDTGALLARLCSVDPEPDARGMMIWALGISALPLAYGACSRELAAQVERRLLGLLPPSPHAVLRGSACRVRALFARAVEGDLGGALAAASEAVRCFEGGGAQAQEAQARLHLGLLRIAVGDHGEAASELRETARRIERFGAEAAAAPARAGLAEALLGQGLLGEALSQGLRAVASAEGRPFVAAWARRVLGAVHLSLGDADEALRCADEALAALPTPCAERLAALVLRADALAQDGQREPAREAAAQAVAVVRAGDPLVQDEHGARGCLAGLLLSGGFINEGMALLAEALDDLRRRAAALPEGLRPALLARAPARRVGELARRWLLAEG